jgi:glycosyltransferase involved in cell wall biosynthesis
VKNELLPSLYASCDLLVLPSYSEGLPNVVMEAMACGLPVVATRVGENPELLKDCRGFLVSPKDPKILEKSIKELLTNQALRKKVIYNARKYIEKEHSYSIIKKKYIEMVEKLIR